MSLCGETEIAELPINLQEYVNSFNIETATAIDLSLPNLTDENLSLFIRCISSKYGYEENIETLKKLLELELQNSQNPQQLEVAAQAYQTGLAEALSANMYLVDHSPRYNREPDITKSRLRNIMLPQGTYNILHKHTEHLDEARCQLVEAAFKKALFDQFDRGGRNTASFDTSLIGQADEYSLTAKISAYKKEYILEKAKNDMQAKGLGLSIEERRELAVNQENNQKLLSYCLGYSYKVGLLSPRSISPIVERETMQAYHEWLWPELQKEALIEFEESYGIKSTDYNLDNPVRRRKYFEAIYTQHYEKELKNQSIGDLRIYPDMYSSAVYHKDMIQSTFDFMAKGAFRSKVGVGKFELNAPRDNMIGFQHGLDEFLEPFVEHVKNGRPIPFRKMEVIHSYPPSSEEDADLILNQVVAVAEGMADHPADYFKLASVGFKFAGDETNIRSNFKIDRYLTFMKQMNKLVDREENPLRVELDLDEVNQYFFDLLVRFENEIAENNGLENLDEIIQLRYAQIKELTDNIDHYRYKVAENRRKVNYKILIEGEVSLGDMTELEMADSQETKVESLSEVRACKRITSLDDALRGASMQQEMEEEQEQEQEAAQEKEQEAEQDQNAEQENVHGSIEDNLTNLEEFSRFVHDTSHYQINEGHIKQLWHNLCGETQTMDNSWVAGENIQAVSKDAVSVMLQDPDVFRSGLVDGNLPQGFHFGLLAVENGSSKGIYFDLGEPDLTVDNPLTIKFSDPIESLPRLKASPSHFNVKAKLTGIKGGIIKGLAKNIPGGDPLKEPTKDEIDSYNSGYLNFLNSNHGAPIDGWAVVGKMAYCTATETKSVLEYRSWANDPITRSISKVVEPQVMAEYAISLGGDAVFDLTDRLKALKKRCGKMHKAEIFDEFLDDYVLQKENDSWFRDPNVPNFCEHMFRHGQFQGMEDVLELNDPDFEFFMKFVNKHAKHHCRTDLKDLLNSFQYFKAQYNEIFPGQELPVDNLDEFIENCTDMRVGMDRILIILRNAQKHGLEDEQLAVLTQLDLRYQTTYHAVEHNKFKLVLPEMKADWESLKNSIVPKKSTITPLQSTVLYNQFIGAMSVEDCRTEFYRQFALIDDTPNFSKFKSLDNLISGISGPEFDNPDYTKAALYTLAGFVLYKPSTSFDIQEYLTTAVELELIKQFLSKSENSALLKRLNKITDAESQKSILIELNTDLSTNNRLTASALIETVNRRDVYNVAALNNLAKSIDSLNLSDDGEREKYARFFKQIHECQIPYVNGLKKRGAPTPENLKSYIDTIQRLHIAGLFSEVEPTRNTIYKCIRTQEFFDNSGELFNVIHQISQREGEDCVTDKQLAHLLVNLENSSHIALQEPNPVNEKFATLQGGLLAALGVIKQPGEHFTAGADNEDSLKYFIQQIQQQACGENALKYESVSDTLKVLSCVDWENIEPRPTFAQMKSMLIKSMSHPQPNYSAVKNWITSEANAGFQGIDFDITQLATKNVESMGIAEKFDQNKVTILQGFRQQFQDIELDETRTAEFGDFVNYLLEEEVEGQIEKFSKSALLATLKQTLFAGAKGGIDIAKRDSLSKTLKTSEKDRVITFYDKNYGLSEFNPNNLNELKRDFIKISAAQAHAKVFFENIDSAKTGLGAHFNILMNILSDGRYNDVPINMLNDLVLNLVEDFKDNKIFNHAILSVVTEYEYQPEIVDKWPLINNIIKAQVLENATINKADITQLILNLAKVNGLRSNDIGDLLAIAEQDIAVYNQIINSMNQSIDSGEDVNFNQVNSVVAKLISENIDSDVLVHFLAEPIHIQLLDKVNCIDDSEKKLAIIKIISHAQDYVPDGNLINLKKLVDSLEQLSAQNLKTLSTLDIDAKYPTVTELTESATKIASEVNQYNINNYIADLQAEFFARKNDPDNLNMLFNDGRVVGVLDASETLKYGIDQHLSQEKKEKLLSDYAYIHAIGLNKPVFNDKSMKDLTKGEIRTLRDQLLETIRRDSTEIEKHTAMLKMIALSREVYYRSNLPEIRFPYSTQVMSTLMALDNGKLNINEIATGQGKSLTAALYATVLWAQEKPVVICTSNLTLAKEGLEENEPFYEYMGMSTSLIKAQTSSDDFQHSGVNYTDVSNMALFLAKNEIQGKFDVKNPGLILDEADFTVLDEVTDFRYAVNLDNMSSELNMDEWLYYKLNEFVDRPEFTENLVDRQSDVSNAIAFFRSEFKKEVDLGLLEDPFKSHLENRILDFQMESSEAQKQLDTWIDSAWNARMIYQEGRDKAWVLEKLQHKDGNEYSVARIISHHRVSKGSKWSKGVHQFLHARINSNAPEEQLKCRVDVEKSHVAAYSSKNFVDYFASRGGAVWGMTGTVGSPEERAELREKYGFELARVETHQVRTAKDLKPVFTKNANGHVKAVYGLYEANSLKSRQMPTVIVEENAKIAGDFREKFFARLNRNVGRYTPPPTVQFYNGITLEIHDFKNGRYVSRDILEDFGREFESSEEKEDYIKKVAGRGNTVTITTPMMGRGTDFKPTMSHPDQTGQYQAHPDGLFVIQNYVDGSIREQRQIQGRMGRQGKKGLYVNVIDKSRFIDKLKSTVPNPPRSVTRFNQNQLEIELGRYQASANSNLAKERQLKQTFGDMRGHFYQKFIGMMAFSNDDKRFNEVKHILRDVEDFSEPKFQKEYNAYMLVTWNRFLIDIDKKFILLKDEYNNDYEEIFPKLQEFCFNEWNQKIIEGVKNSQFNDDKSRLEADAMFAEFQEFKPDQLDKYAELMFHRDLIDEEREEMEVEALQRELIVKGVQDQPEMAKELLDTFMPESEYSELVDQVVESPQLLDTVLQDKMEHKTHRVVGNTLREQKRIKAEIQKNIEEGTLEENEQLQKELDALDIPVYDNATYALEYNAHRHDLTMGKIIEKGRKAALLDPDLNIQRAKLDRAIVNYNKHFWLKDLPSLKSTEEPEKEIAQIMAIDTLNDLFKLNSALSQDHILKLTTQTPFEILAIENPFPGDDEISKYKANHYLAEYISQQPKVSLSLLQQYYMNTSITAQLASDQTALQSQKYNRLLEEYTNGQQTLLETLGTVDFNDPQLLPRFKTLLVEAKSTARLHAKQETYTFLLKTNPTRAVEYGIEHGGLASSRYDYDALVSDIKADTQNYLKSKWLNKSRKKNAKLLLKDLDSSQDINQSLAALLKARSHALQSDIKSFGTKNKRGSRYQRLINKSITRTIASADNEGDLLLCTDHMRKEMCQQLDYLKSKFDSVFYENYFEPIYQESLDTLGMLNPDNPQDLSLKEINDFIDDYTARIKRVRAINPNQSTRIAIDILDENLSVFKLLRQKMIAQGMDMQSEVKIIKDISLETNVYEVSEALELDAGQHRMPHLDPDQNWPKLTIEQWNQRFALEYTELDQVAPTIQSILGHGDTVVSEIKPSDMHKIIGHSKDTNLWNVYLAQCHEETIQMIERNNAKFDRRKFPAVKTIEDILGENRAPASPVDFFKVITEMNQYKNQIASPNSKTDRIQLFSMSGHPQIPITMMPENAQNFMRLAHDNIGPWGPPLTENKVNTVFGEFDNLDKDLTESEEWQNYWNNDTERRVIRLAKSTLIKQKKSEYVRQHRLENPKDKNLPKSKILEGFELDSIPEIRDFDEQVVLASIKEEILSAYRFKVISNSEFIDDKDDPKYQLKTTRCKDFLQRINAKKRIGKTYQEANQELKSEFEDSLRSEVQSSIAYYEKLVKEGHSLDSVTSMMYSNILSIERKPYNAYLGLSFDTNEFIKPLMSQYNTYCAFNELLTTQLELVADGFVPTDGVDNNTRVLELIKNSVDTILNNPAYEAMGILGRDALKSRLTSKESIEAVYMMALEKRTKHYKDKIINHYNQRQPGSIQWLLENEDTGVKWVTYPRARRELIGNLYNAVKSGEQLFSPTTHGRKTAKTYQKALMSDLLSAYKQTIEDDLKSMPKQHAKALLERLKSDPLLQKTGFRNPFKQDPRLQLITSWSKLVDERPDTPLHAVPGLMTADSHTGLDVNLGLWKELENVINRSEKDKVAIDLMKAEQEIYDLPNEREYILTHDSMKSMLDDKHSHDKIKQSLSSISNLEERISKIEKLFNESRVDENFHFKSKYGMLGGNKSSDNQKKITALLQDLFVDAVESLALKHAHTAVDSESMKWSDQIPEEIPSDVVDKILSEVLNPALENFILNSGSSEIAEQRLKQQIKVLINNVGESRHQEVIEDMAVGLENEVDNQNRGARL
tara:strand:- start:11035 stop:23703 length:12669 start_codon:yes stop_codon:yes gene_type:complete